MGKDSSGSGPVQIDERWLSEWIEKGYQDLLAFLNEPRPVRRVERRTRAEGARMNVHARSTRILASKTAWRLMTPRRRLELIHEAWQHLRANQSKEGKA